MDLPVIIERVAFRNDNGYAVLSANLDPYSKLYNEEMEDVVKDCINKKYGSFTITVGMLSPDDNPKGGQYVFVGEIVNDKKFGKQFKAEFYYQDIPSTEDGLKAFLCEIPNIKKARSEAIIMKFGFEGTIDILDNNINRLTEISGITVKRIPAILKFWNEKKYLKEIYAFFTQYKVQLGLAIPAFKKWGKDTMKVVEDNPYCLTELKGIGFITADKIAHQIKTNIEIKSRVKSCLKYILEEAFSKQSNLCLPYSALKTNLEAVLKECDVNLGKKVDVQTYVAAIPACLKSNLEIFTLVKDVIENEIYIYLSHVWNKEKYIAQSIYNRKNFDGIKKECSDFDIQNAEENVSSFNKRKIVLDDCQKDAIKSAFENKITVITGGGGTGKSMLCRCIFSIAQEKGLSIRMMSPTGKAAQVLSEKTGCGASTIHRSLKMRPGDDVVREDIKEDIVLIDEVSMCGIDTMYALMKSLENNKWGNIVFVGDKNQLPSVSLGNFLSDIMESKCANIVTLNKIHRQDEKSYISLLANEISKGKVVEVPEEALDMKWHSLNPNTICDDIRIYIDEYLNSGKNIDDLQVLSPMKRGICGVYNINEVIQLKMASLNRNEDSLMTIGFNRFFKGDRVIQLENNSDKAVFNGDMGIICDLGEKIFDQTVSDKEEKFITVKFPDQEMTYIGSEIEQLQLAWVITVHKYQGSQSKNIIFIMAEEAKVMMSRELVYTGFTRAEKQLDIFGHINMLRLAPTKSVIKKRYSNFKKLIDEFRGCQKTLEVKEFKK